MDNPFMIDYYIQPYVSLNKLVVHETYNLIEDDINNKMVSDIFSTQIVISEIKKNAEKLNIKIESTKDLQYPYYLEQSLHSSDQVVLQTAEEITRKLGRRLGVILLTLKEGSRNGHLSKTEWNTLHWNYWKKINTIFLVGGLTSGLLGLKLKKYAEELLKENRQNVKLEIGTYGQQTGLIGISKLIKAENGCNLLFDFGQSYIKRSIVVSNNNQIQKFYLFDNLKSFYVNSNYASTIEEINKAKRLNQYILQSIIETYNESLKMGYEVNSEIMISIANYVQKGVIYKRGGYGKLCHISQQYDQYLEQQLKHKLKRDFTVHLIHDGTACANAFSESYSACISLGTYFGVGFPIRREFNYKKINKDFEIITL